MEKNNKNKFNKYLQKKDNIYDFDFKAYHQDSNLENFIKKYKFKKGTTPIQILKIFNKFIKENSITFNDFLNYLERNQIWNENQSIEFYLKKYIRKYGPLKIQYILNKENYSEEKIRIALTSIPNQIWLKYAKENYNKIIEKLKKENPEIVKRKIIQKLIYLGYPEEIIYEIIENFFDNKQ